MTGKLLAHSIPSLFWRVNFLANWLPCNPPTPIFILIFWRMYGVVHYSALALICTPDLLQFGGYKHGYTNLVINWTWLLTEMTPKYWQLPPSHAYEMPERAGVHFQNREVQVSWRSYTLSIFMLHHALW